jgi:hypothetical protein
MLEDARREHADPASVAPAMEVVALGVASVDGVSALGATEDSTMVAAPLLRDETVAVAPSHGVGPLAYDDMPGTSGKRGWFHARMRIARLYWYVGAGVAPVAVLVALFAAGAFGGGHGGSTSQVLARSDGATVRSGVVVGDAGSHTPMTAAMLAIATASQGTQPAYGPTRVADVAGNAIAPPVGGSAAPPAPTQAPVEGGAPTTNVPPTTPTPVVFVAATATAPSGQPTMGVPTAPPPPPPTSAPPTATFTPTYTPTTTPPPPPVAELRVVDDTDGGFSRGTAGAQCPSPGIENLAYNWCWGNAVKNGVAPYGGHYWYTWNNSGLTDQNWGKWVPNLTAAASYRVCAYIPPDHAYSHNARYQIHRNGGVSTVSLNQQNYAGWVSLGVFDFPAGSGGYVYLGDATNEGWATMMVGYDAMKWVPNGGGC